MTVLFEADIRIPHWQLNRAELRSVIAHEMAHAEVWLTGGSDAHGSGLPRPVICGVSPGWAWTLLRRNADQSRLSMGAESIVVLTLAANNDADPSEIEKAQPFRH